MMTLLRFLPENPTLADLRSRYADLLDLLRPMPSVLCVGHRHSPQLNAS